VVVGVISKIDRRYGWASEAVNQDLIIGTQRHTQLELGIDRVVDLIVVTVIAVVGVIACLRS
jgi:hypothetical protein